MASDRRWCRRYRRGFAHAASTSLDVCIHIAGHLRVAHRKRVPSPARLAAPPLEVGSWPAPGGGRRRVLTCSRRREKCLFQHIIGRVNASYAAISVPLVDAFRRCSAADRLHVVLCFSATWNTQASPITGPESISCVHLLLLTAYNAGII